MDDLETKGLPDQSGRVVVVTGASSGIGAATARALAAAGAKVTLAVRDRAKGERVALTMPGDTEVRSLDLESLASIRAFAAAWTGDIDILINNAGIMLVAAARTSDGFERQIGTNHLGHFALTNLLLPHITNRVVTVSSNAHARGRLDLDDLNWQTRPYRTSQAYSDSKLANLLFTFELQRRADAAGVELLALSAHPGYAATNLQTAGPRLAGNKLMERATEVVSRVIGQSARDGALPTLRAATDPAVRGGEVFGPDGLLELRGAPKRVAVSSRARDRAVAERLWEVSEEKTGVRYPALDPA